MYKFAGNFKYGKLAGHKSRFGKSGEKLEKRIGIESGVKNRKHKLFTLINSVGLSISAALVIYLIVHFDLTFDKFQKDSNRIYMLMAALFTLSFQTIKAAIANPVRSLRSE